MGMGIGIPITRITGPACGCTAAAAPHASKAPKEPERHPVAGERRRLASGDSGWGLAVGGWRAAPEQKDDPCS